MSSNPATSSNPAASSNPEASEYTFARYLASKRSVDDRALNRVVWEQMAAAAAARRQANGGAFAVLEVAAGIGTMVERVLEWGLFAAEQGPVAYTAIDADAENIAAAHSRLGEQSDSLPPWLSLRLEAADVFDFCERPQESGQYDLLIAHAFLDLLDVPRALPRLRRLLKPGGLFYFTINFDGATILQPEIDAPFDAEIEAAYHRTMDERITDGRLSGDSRSGRHLFGQLAAAGCQVFAAGSSDWVVYPAGGRYPAAEAYFLHFIVHTMHAALRDHPAIAGKYGAAAFDRWIEVRHAQIERGELVYIAHQLDFAGRI